MTAATLTEPVTTPDADIADEAAAPCCQVFNARTGEQCDRPVAAWIEFHRVGDCKSTECNPRGNMEGNVCTEHLDMFIELAVEVSHQGPPEGVTHGLFGPCQIQRRCGSCGMPINQASDVLQKVIRT